MTCARRTLALAVTAGLLASCGQGNAEQTGREARFEALADAYRKGHERRDLKALRGLVHAPEVALAAPDTFSASVKDDFAREIAAIQFKPLAAGERLEYEMRGVTFRPTLPPTGRMHVSFAAPPAGASNGVQVTETSYLVGVDRGQYRIVLAGPVKG